MERLIHINHLSYVFMGFHVVDLAGGEGRGKAVDLMTAPQNEILKEYVFLEKPLSCNTPRVL